MRRTRCAASWARSGPGTCSAERKYRDQLVTNRHTNSDTHLKLDEGNGMHSFHLMDCLCIFGIIEVGDGCTSSTLSR